MLVSMAAKPYRYVGAEGMQLLTMRFNVSLVPRTFDGPGLLGTPAIGGFLTPRLYLHMLRSVSAIGNFRHSCMKLCG